MIIDCHCHAGEGDGFSGPWDSDAGLERYLARARAAGVQRTVLLAAFHSDYGRANRSVARIVASDPTRFYGFAFVHAEHDRGRVRHPHSTHRARRAGDFDGRDRRAAGRAAIGS